MSIKYKVQSTKLSSEIFKDNLDFEKTALEIFRFQSNENAVYKKYIEQLKINPGKINSIAQIPFLPIQFFKTHKVICSALPSSVFRLPSSFSSSGTTGNETSKHYVTDLKIYEQSLLKCFELFYGNIEEYCVLALLPSYLERKDSSLIYMTDLLIKKSNHSKSGFYLNNFNELSETLKELENQKQKTILLGVTYALLDFAEMFPIKLKHTIIMETGGMKGKRKEILREEVHKILSGAFAVEKIQSEYGMTELLSQAYSKGDGIFFSPPWMKILIRDVNDPMVLIENEKPGGINIIDLANIYSCSFIATQDVGKKIDDACLPDSQGSFEVLGRFDESDLRGCNLMIE
ncbi:MAG TPA: acyl transferase [Bacteroidia bacterium]|nr:acyl transferase [Bacteroidia bacterium]